MDPYKAIGEAPTRFRVSQQGVTYSRVDRNAGRAGAILGLAVATRGEALGHGMWLDQRFLEQVEEAGADSDGVKARFTHPGMSSDGLGKLLGRVRNFSFDGDVVRGDLYFVRSAHKTPDGNLADYAMTLAEESPDMAGLSIVFERDADAEQAFSDAHSDPDGEFLSPDPNNTQNLLHVRLAALNAVDMVDSPAANPDGLFSADDGQLARADAAIRYAFGLADTIPDDLPFGIHPERIKRYLSEFLARHELIVSNETQERTGPDAAGSELQEVSQMSEIQDLTAEQFEELRPDLMEELRAGLKDDSESDTESAINEDRERVAAILGEARALGLAEAGDDLINEGTPVDAAMAALRGKALEALRASVAVNPGPNAEANGPEAQKAPDVELAEKADAYLAEHPEVTYRDALSAVSQ